MTADSPRARIRGIESEAAQELQRSVAYVREKQQELDEAERKMRAGIVKVITEGQGSGPAVAEIVGISRQRVAQIVQEAQGQ